MCWQCSLSSNPIPSSNLSAADTRAHHTRYTSTPSKAFQPLRHESNALPTHPTSPGDPTLPPPLRHPHLVGLGRALGRRPRSADAVNARPGRGWCGHKDKIQDYGRVRRPLSVFRRAGMVEEWEGAVASPLLPTRGVPFEAYRRLTSNMAQRFNPSILSIPFYSGPKVTEETKEQKRKRASTS